MLGGRGSEVGKEIARGVFHFSKEGFHEGVLGGEKGVILGCKLNK